jgi:hypothetical protein
VIVFSSVCMLIGGHPQGYGKFRCVGAYCNSP